MAVIIHDHGDPSPVVAAVSPDVQTFAASVQPRLAPIVEPPPPPPTVKEVAAAVEFADVVDKKKSP